MATRKMTFTVPEELAVQLVRRVPARRRSRYIAEALREKLAQRDRQLLRACQIANQDAEVRSIEEEFDSLSPEIAEPWTATPARRSLVGPARSRARVRN